MPLNSTTADEEVQPNQSFRKTVFGWNRFWPLGGLLLMSALAIAGFLISSSLTAGMGFPLDDAWIHQTYARNLAQLGEWSFIPGQPSAGSTAPLWSVLLSIGYLLNLAPFGWAFLLGGTCLFGVGWVGQQWYQTLRPSQNTKRLAWAGLLLIGEWHLVWAAVSGMETLLMACLILFVLWRTARASGRDWFLVGLLIGLSVWIRPDGITLLGPAGLTLLLVEAGWVKRLRGTGWLAGGVALLFGPYLLFNWLVQGSIWPNTFYAKQAEYAIMRELPLLTRFINEATLPLIGGGLFLLPGVLTFTWQAFKNKQWFGLSAIIWFLGYALLYALRLPVTYQYGRYFIPAMPVYFVCGLVGTAWLVERLHHRRIPWLLARVWLMSGIGIWIAFYILGAGRYAQDVTIIESEMVAAAKWVAANTPANALIAAHDIGALGYYGQRDLLDLAGLVSPEVIPFIRDEQHIAAWLDQRSADYLVVMDGWYDHLGKDRQELWRSVQNGSSSVIIYDRKP